MAKTVTALVAMQPVGSVVVIMSTPDATPVTTPVTEPTVPKLVLLLLNVTPEEPDSVIVVPVQSDEGPVIAAGLGLTVITFVAEQPVLPSVYVTVAVPGVPAIKMPDVGVIVPVTEGVLLQRPPGVELVRVPVLPEHTAETPVIGEGAGLTVMG